MTIHANPPVPGAGGRGIEYPELEPAQREAIQNAFNVGNQHFPGLLGIRVVDVRRGYARLRVENRKALSNLAGIMHGGASFGLADSAIAVALIAIYGPGSALLTVEMKINYLEPIFPGEVVADAYVLRSSRSSAYGEVDLWSGGKLAARATTTYMIRPMSQYREASAHTQREAKGAKEGS